MDSPPPYYSPGPKKSNTGLIIGIILGAVCVCCILPIIGIGALGFWGVSKVKGLVVCTFTFTNAQRAIEDYASDHDGKLPNAATWETDIRPYYAKQIAKHKKEQSLFASDPNGPIGCTNGDSPDTGVTFNKAMSGKKISDIKDPFHTVVLFETPNTGKNLNADYKAPNFDLSPMTFGKRRGWYVAHVGGGLNITGRNGELKDASGVRVDDNSDSSSDDGSKDSKDGADGKDGGK